MPLYNPITASQVTGLGTAATQNTGTSGANVPLLNGANTHSGLVTTSAGIKDTGSVICRFENTGGSRPAASDGAGVEITAGTVQSVTVTAGTPALGNLNMDSNGFTMRVNSTVRLTGNTSGIDVTGLVQCDTLRIDAAPTLETVVATHTAVINLNGTSYKFPCLAA